MLQVMIPNYSPAEVTCKDGCGLMPSPECLWTFQAFLIVLRRKMKASVRHIVSGGCRCLFHQAQVYKELNEKRKAEGKPERPMPKDSRHCPPFVDALDGHYEVYRKGTKDIAAFWEKIPYETVAKIAEESGLFGGIGINEYKADGRDLIHLDCRDDLEVVIW